MHELGGQMLYTVGIGLEKSGGLIVDSAGGGLCLQVKRIRAGEAHFHQAPAALHGIKSGAHKIAIEKNISRGGHEIDVVQLRLKNLRVSADGTEIELAGALRANQGAAGSFHDDVARNFL